MSLSNSGETVAPEVLQRKLEHLAGYVRDLEPFKGCSLETYQVNNYKVDRLLELIVTVAIDIIHHLLAERGEPPILLLCDGVSARKRIGDFP